MNKFSVTTGFQFGPLWLTLYLHAILLAYNTQLTCHVGREQHITGRPYFCKAFAGIDHTGSIFKQDCWIILHYATRSPWDHREISAGSLGLITCSDYTFSTRHTSARHQKQREDSVYLADFVAGKTYKTALRFALPTNDLSSISQWLRESNLVQAYNLRILFKLSLSRRI